MEELEHISLERLREHACSQYAIVQVGGAVSIKNFHNTMKIDRRILKAEKVGREKSALSASVDHEIASIRRPL